MFITAVYRVNFTLALRSRGSCAAGRDGSHGRKVFQCPHASSTPSSGRAGHEDTKVLVAASRTGRRRSEGARGVPPPGHLQPGARKECADQGSGSPIRSRRTTYYVALGSVFTLRKENILIEAPGKVGNL